MATIKLKGPGLNDFFAEEMVRLYGPEDAREKSCGPMLEAVERVIAKRTAQVLKAFDDLTHEDRRGEAEQRATVERAARARL